MKVFHELQPIYNKNSKVLILGSIPSVKSREENFYYAHPKNRFWMTLSRVYGEEILNTKEDKIKFLNRHNIALFDVIKSCEIISSKDSSIKNVVPNDLTPILKNSNIKAIFTTGKKAHELYQKYIFKETNINSILLPSTSAANTPKGIEEKLFESYKIIKEYTDN